MPTAPSLVVFDLDGTLLDSAPLIVECANAALDGRAEISSLDIGPPLERMLARASGLPEAGVEVASMAARFAELYDPRSGLSEPFEGASDLLEALRSGGHLLALATHKRSAPARRVLKALRWEGVFPLGVYCSEDFAPLAEALSWPFGAAKSAALARARSLGSELGLSWGRERMVGDGAFDSRAAVEARFSDFHWALWGGASEDVLADALLAPGLATHRHADPRELARSAAGWIRP